MKMQICRSARARRRQGTAAVEFALALPVFLTFVFGTVEIGRIRMTVNLLQVACRMGARYGAAEGVSSSEVQARVRETLSAIVDSQAIEIVVKDASVYDTAGDLPSSRADFEGLPDVNLEDAQPRQLYLVRASVAYNDVALIPFSHLQNMSFVGQSFMRHE